MCAQPKTLIVDCDGVSLNFSLGYINYLASVHGIHPVKQGLPSQFNFKDLYPEHDAPWRHIKDFTESFEHFSQLTPVHNAHLALKQIKSSGLFERTIMLTACGDSESTIRAREASIKRVFDDSIDEVIYLPLQAPKSEPLQKLMGKYGRSVVVDDLLEHCVSALEIGHEALLFSQDYNLSEHHEALLSGDIRRINCLSQLLNR